MPGSVYRCNVQTEYFFHCVKEGMFISKAVEV